MARVRVVHWRKDESRPLLDALARAGHQTEYEPDGPEMLRQVRRSLPDVVVIDLSRLPSHGREVAVALRASKLTCSIPLVFVDGLPDKVEEVRRWLPDAVFTTQARVSSAIKKALTQRPESPVTPTPMMDRYQHRSTAQKLGVREGMQVGVLDPPQEYLRVLGEMPAGVEFVENPEAPPAVTLWFVRDADEYRRGLVSMRNWAGSTRLWVLWPKQTGRASKPSVTENMVRESALAVGLVDYKICSVDATWSGMALAKRKA